MFFKKISFPKADRTDRDKNAGKIKYLIVGLGNPGQKYIYTRHNAGFLALDYIAQKYNFKINIIKYKSYCAKYRVDNGSEISESSDKSDKSDKLNKLESFEVLFMKPQTFMNNSGEAVSEAARFYKIPPTNILVISDDITLPVGKLRIKKSGSDGGHNGLKSIIYHLSSNAFPRIKIGVGEKPHPDYDLVDWVTSGFSKEDEKIIFNAFSKVYDCVDMFIKELPIDKIQIKFN